MVKFVVTKNRRYWWPVKIRVPAEEERRAGTMVEFQFKAHFEAIDSDEAKEIITAVAELPEAERGDRQNDLLLRVVVGWDEDILDQDKKPIEFSTDILGDLLKDPFIALGFWTAWNKSMTGDAGRRGN